MEFDLPSYLQPLPEFLIVSCGIPHVKARWYLLIGYDSLVPNLYLHITCSTLYSYNSAVK